MKITIAGFLAGACLALAVGSRGALAGEATVRTFPAAVQTVELAVTNAHTELWRRFVDSQGVIRDFVGETPTPEDCREGRPNAIGWWSPIENGPMFTGLYLPAACERARRSGDPVDRENVRRLVAGLLTCASVSNVPGFIARGVGTDGKCHYPLGSDDQTHPWFLGLHAYWRSDLPTKEERTQIAAKLREVGDVLEASGWRCPCDGAFTGDSRGAYRGHMFRDAVRYLHLLRVMYDVTQDAKWRVRYEQAAAERPEKSTLTRREICAGGYAPDRETFKSLDEASLWIYVGAQRALASLAALETDPARRAEFQAGLAANVQNALPSVAAHREFDNEDPKIFGHAKWREGYPTWFPQRTQSDAAKLAATGDKTKLGARKGYESRYVRNPLAAAAIVALGGLGVGQDSVEEAIRHYDYTKLNMAEFFFAECAYYTLPVIAQSMPRTP